MKNQDSFSLIYDGMSVVYSKIEDLMGSVMLRVKDNPDDEDARNLLNGFKDVVQSYLAVQKEFVSSYGGSQYASRLVSEIDDKFEGSQIKMGR